MYIQLDMGWMHHPFSVSSFRISSPEQIAVLRGLGLETVRFVPSKSDMEWHNYGLDLPPAFEVTGGTKDTASAAVSQEMTGSLDVPSVSSGAEQRRQLIDQQNGALAACDARFLALTRNYQLIESVLDAEPDKARHEAQTLIATCVADMLDNGDSVIRLLSEGVGERHALHPVNVMVICLLLGRALGLSSTELQDLGVAALVHDMGKRALPAHMAELSGAMTPEEKQRYESHVGESVACATRMGLPESVLLAIAQHHEMIDGSGFPLCLVGEDLGRAGQILALVNRYDRMCNPDNGVEAYTPHDALSIIFAQLRSMFDPVVLGAFIRMMGVYPPGSIVQLVDERYAIVASVNSSRPLRPKIIVHDVQVPKDEALILDLEMRPELGIRRSLKPAQLPRDALDYLSPRRRICYFFERAVHSHAHEVTP